MKRKKPEAREGNPKCQICKIPCGFDGQPAAWWAYKEKYFLCPKHYEKEIGPINFCQVCRRKANTLYANDGFWLCDSCNGKIM